MFNIYVKDSVISLFGIGHKKKKMLGPECIYNPIMAMGFSAMFTFQLDNTKRDTLEEYGLISPFDFIS